MGTLLQEVQSMKARLDRQDTSQKKKKNKKDGKESKKSKKSSRKKRAKKKGRKGGSSSGRSRSSRGSSRSSSSSSSTSSEHRFLRWQARSKNRKVSPSAERRVEAEKFKAKSDLLAFAAREPGALAAFFLCMIHRRLSHGRVSESKQLRQVNISQWATQFTGLSEQRDLKEVYTLATVMDLVNNQDLSAAMDVMAQRIIAIQRAKTKGGSWEKAEAVELLSGPGSSPAASGLLRLTG